MSARAAGLRALDLAPRLIPETRFAEDRKFRPLFTVATLLCFGTTFLPLMRAVPRGMDSIVWIPFVLLGLAFLFFMLIQRVSKWAMPSSLHLVPGLRVDLGLTVALHWLAISLFASGVLLNFVTFGYYAAALPILLLALVLDLPASRLRTLIWALAIAAAAVLYVAAMSARPGVRILGSADLHSIEYGVGLWLVVATALAMVGLVYVKPLSTVGLSIIWIWLMKDPHALVFFNFNEVLKLTYATFSQLGTHALTAGIAFGVLLYWLVGRKADNAIQQRGAESMGEAAMRQPMDALPTRSWLRQPYNLSLGRVLRSPTRARTGIDQINALTFALGPGAHWSTIVGTVAGMTVVAVVFLLAVGPELRMGLKYSQTWFILMMVGILAVQSYQDRVAKRNIEISLLMLTPAWPGTYKARDLFAYQAAAYFAVLIVAVVVAALVVRGIPDDVVRWADTRPPAWFLVYSGIVLWLAAVVVAWQLMLRGDWRSRKSKLPDRLAYFVISVLPLFLLFILDRKAPEYLPPASGLLLIVLIGLAWCQLLRLRKA